MSSKFKTWCQRSGDQVLKITLILCVFMFSNVNSINGGSYIRGNFI